MIISVIKSDFKACAAFIREWIYLKSLGFRMTMLIMRADMKQFIQNRQYHVLPVMLPDGRESIVECDRHDIDYWKRNGGLPRHIQMFELKKNIIIYSTPENRNNKSTHAERMAAREKYIKRFRRFTK